MHHCIDFPFGNKSIPNWLLLSTVHSTTPALNSCHHCYMVTLHHVGFALYPSISSLNFVSIYKHKFIVLAATIAGFTMLLSPHGFHLAGPLSLQFTPSSSGIYQFLHCLKILSQNSLVHSGKQAYFI